MSYDILAGKEFSCLASKVEIANDDRSIMSAFKRFVSNTDNQPINENLASTSKRNKESFIECQNVASASLIINNETNDVEMTSDEERKFFAEDVVYVMSDNGKIKEISRGQPPSTKHFECSKVFKKIA